MAEKKCVSFKQASSDAGMSEEQKEALESLTKLQRAQLSGIAGLPKKEPVPNYIKTSTEKIYKNDNNAWVVLGRDRPGARPSGYGGRGDSQAAAIDIVVGRMGADVIEYDKDNKSIWVNTDFQRDAARIYISQKTDVDANFNLASGRVGSAVGLNEDEFAVVGNANRKAPSSWKPIPRSAIALKADGIRLIAREGIKLVTRTDARNSQGSCIQGIQGIDIIAGNDDKDLQPMVKGDNLQQALERLTHHMDKLNGIVNSLLTHQTSLNKELVSHFHFSPFDGLPTTISPSVQSKGIKTVIDHLVQVKRSLTQHKTNLATYKEVYLSQKGKFYINSRYNNTN